MDWEKMFKLRLVVARLGEMDLCSWWNTTRLLGAQGSSAVSRGLPKTHRFARARTVSVVARERCREVYRPKDGVTLWDLPPDVEAGFESQWNEWLATDRFSAQFEQCAALEPASDLGQALRLIADVPGDVLEWANQMKRAADQRAVPLGEINHLDDNAISLLAAGFVRSDVGALAVPYLRIGGRG